MLLEEIENAVAEAQSEEQFRRLIGEFPDPSVEPSSFRAEMGLLLLRFKLKSQGRELSERQAAVGEMYPRLQRLIIKCMRQDAEVVAAWGFQKQADFIEVLQWGREIVVGENRNVLSMYRQWNESNTALGAPEGAEPTNEEDEEDQGASDEEQDWEFVKGLAEAAMRRHPG